MVRLPSSIVSKQALHIAVFCKPPIHGEVKTRLIPTYGTAEATRIYVQLVERTLRTVRAACFSLDATASLWVAGDTSHPAILDWAERFALPVVPQSAGDLGAKMFDCLEVLARDHERVLLTGTDCPVLDLSHLRAASTALTSGCPWVFMPAEDGGYVLVGSNLPSLEPFTHIDWSTAKVMTQTRAALAANAVTWAETTMLWDVDEAADVERARAANLLDSH